MAGWLEPAGDVGCDTFDFSVERDALHLSMPDAMGHTLSAALLATVLVGILRNARRRAVGLAEHASLANESLCRASPRRRNSSPANSSASISRQEPGGSSTPDTPPRFASATVAPSVWLLPPPETWTGLEGADPARKRGLLGSG
jgi:hypothetical protein